MFKNFRNTVLDSLDFITNELGAAGLRGAGRMNDIVALLGITNAHMSLNNDRLDAIDARLEEASAHRMELNARMGLNNDRLDAIDARLEEASAHRMELDDAMEMVHDVVIEAHDAVLRMDRSSGPLPVTTSTTSPGPTNGHWSWTELGVQGPDGDDGKDA